MNALELTPRALLHLLFNGARAIDVVETAHGLGMWDVLEAGPVTLGELSQRYGMVPGRLYKFLDCLESLGLVRREQTTGAIVETRYLAVSGVRAAAEQVVGPRSLERDREKYAWHELHRHLPQVLSGERSMSRESFDWPPHTFEQVADFEASMAAGLGPIVEVFGDHAARLWRDGQRLLEVGGGDGSLAAHLLARHAGLTVDVYNLWSTEALVAQTREAHHLGARLGFKGGDFLQEPLPTGYDAISFVRVLHDWPAETARALMKSAWEALPSGGRILICEEFRTPERLPAQFFWSYFLMGVDSCVSQLREIEYYLHSLEQLGFIAIEVLPGSFEVIVATRP
jgi:SAM-dependent methyltransferase